MTDQPSKELAVTPANNYLGMELADIKNVAQVMFASGIFKDLRDTNMAFAKILAGQEMGITPFAALQEITFINGKPSLSATSKAAKIKQSGKYDFKIVELDAKHCILEFFEHGKSRGKVEYNEEMAKLGGEYSRNPNYKTHPDDMYYAGAVRKGQKRYAPDALSGVSTYDPEEWTEGEIVETGPQTLPESPQTDAVTAGEVTGTDKEGPETMAYVDEYPTEADLQTALDALKPNPISPKQRAFLFSLLTQAGVPASKAKGALYAIASHYLSREITKTEDISKEDAIGLIDFIQSQDAAALEMFFGDEA